MGGGSMEVATATLALSFAVDDFGGTRDTLAMGDRAVRMRYEAPTDPGRSVYRGFDRGSSMVDLW